MNKIKYFFMCVFFYQCLAEQESPKQHNEPEITKKLLQEKQLELIHYIKTTLKEQCEDLNKGVMACLPGLEDFRKECRLLSILCEHRENENQLFENMINNNAHTAFIQETVAKIKEKIKKENSWFAINKALTKKEVLKEEIERRDKIDYNVLRDRIIEKYNNDQLTTQDIEYLWRNAFVIALSREKCFSI